ncbi:TetR/AcrR family transcriptional regulator, partial [Phytoactinopolyspora endophytica]|uniref:TetR/AcrR family transcriptional regulator n=1 Tax=Phytoactinopolyspora endophytica TaxID=1642495 RepID=UPI0013EA3068
AAAEIMRTDGIARATTKEIAQRAGFSEATLYKHFVDKTAIFGAVLEERLPELGAALRHLAGRVGEGSVEQNLEEVVHAALLFYDEGFPMAVGLFFERRLLESHRAGVLRHGSGPRQVNVVISQYVRAEREHGRVRPDADPEAVAAVLMGACFQHAFHRHFYGEQPLADPADTARSLVKVATDGIVVRQPDDG